jgi:adenine-specific DNA-methyltransferase
MRLDSRDQPALKADMVIPHTGRQREALRVNGQFWTPDWVADAMVAYALQDGTNALFDPGVGAGALLRAGKRLRGPSLELRGQEIDPAALSAALQSGLTAEDLVHVKLQDFALHPPCEKSTAIAANPPYVRHHRLSETTKATLHRFARKLIGQPIDGRAGLHVFFLLRCLDMLAPGGRLAFIVSADVCEGVYAKTLWHWIASRFRLDAVATFAPIATPFPGVDTNAILLLIQHAPPQKNFAWVRVTAAKSDSLTQWIKSGLVCRSTFNNLEITDRAAEEGFATGLSRSPTEFQSSKHRLGDFARVMRGIATGRNDFFFMTAKQVQELEIPERYFITAVGRLRDISTEHFSDDDLQKLEAANRPTRLLALGNDPRTNFPPALQRYLQQGEDLDIPASTLIATRNPWYKMEQRTPPPFFFSYLGRRSTRFIRNRTTAVPLTCLLCIYPFDSSPENIEKLWQVFSDPRTLENLRLVGKSYGNGALKVEPRSLQELQLPQDVLLEVGLLPRTRSKQIELVL